MKMGQGCRAAPPWLWALAAQLGPGSLDVSAVGEQLPGKAASLEGRCERVTRFPAVLSVRSSAS